jgi:hypothetical protein
MSVVIHGSPVGDLSMSAEAFLGMSGTGAVSSTLMLNEDGSAAQITTFESAPDDTVAGTWTLEEDHMVIVGAGIDDTVPYELDDTRLTLTIIMPIDFEQDGTAVDTNVDWIYELQ